MKKVIVAFDGLKFSEGTLEYGLTVGKQQKAQLTGVFLENLVYNSFSMYETLDKQGVSQQKIELLLGKDRNTREEAEQLFEKACRQAGIAYNIHRCENFALQDLWQESIYADLLIIDRNETMTKYTEDLSMQFIRDFLPDIQCPVLLVPTCFTPIRRVILLFDGSPVSVHAIKMLYCTMPDVNKLPTEILTVKTSKENFSETDDILMKEFMKDHCPNARYTVLQGDPETEITKYLNEYGDQMLIALGAYHRSNISRWFRHSMANVLVKKLSLPLFITHFN